MTDERMLVLVVGADPGFVDSTRELLAAHRTLVARDLEEAREIVLGGRVDLVILGPAFASEYSVSQSASLRLADATVRIVLAADIVTNRLLKAALRGGFADVVDLPLTAAGLSSVLPLPATADTAREIDLVVEPEAVAPQQVPPHHPSQYEPTEPASHDAEETLGSGNGWAASGRSVPRQAPVTSEPGAAGPVDDTVPHQDDPSAPASPTAPAWAEQDEVDVTPVPAPAMEEPRPVEHRPAAAEQPSAPVWPGEEAADPQPSPAPSPQFLEETEPETGAMASVAPPVPSEPDIAAPMPSTEPPPFPTDQPEVPPVAVIPEMERETPAPAPRGPGRVIAVMAGKGGSGKTVVAINLAIALGLRDDPERIAIVDADLQFGDVALMLQVDPVRTIDDVVGRLDSMTDAWLDGALLRHETGLRVLPAPLLPVRHDEITAKSVVEVVERLRNVYDTIIVDTGPVFDDGLVTILEHADAVVTVVDMDLPSVKNAKVVLDALRGGGFPMDRVTLVVNRVNSKARLDLAELEHSLGLRVGGSIPSDRLVPESVNEGIPLLALSPRSKVARSFMALSERLDPAAGRSRLGGGR